jgi:hypothetical protein
LERLDTTHELSMSAGRSFPLLYNDKSETLFVCKDHEV